MLSGLCNSSVTSVSVNILGGNGGEREVEHNVGDVAHTHTGGFLINSVICRQRSQGPVKSKSTDERHHKSSQFNLSTRMLYPIFLDTRQCQPASFKFVDVCVSHHSHIVPSCWHIGCTIVHCIMLAPRSQWSLMCDICKMWVFWFAPKTQSRTWQL